MNIQYSGMKKTKENEEPEFGGSMLRRSSGLKPSKEEVYHG